MVVTFMSKGILFLLFLHLNKTADSFKIIDIDDVLQPKLAKDFENSVVIKDDNNAENYNKIHEYQDLREITKSIEEKKQPKRHAIKKGENYKNKVLIKRIIPHGFAQYGIEYDHKFNTAYKPFIRVHNRKPINQFLNEIKAQTYDGTPNKDSKHESIIFVLPEDAENQIFKKEHNLNDKDLLQPFERFKKRFNFKDLVKQIQDKIKLIKPEPTRIKAYAKIINVLNNMLRSPQFAKSAEATEPIKKKSVNKSEEKKPKKWIPHYPPWNYWTYYKTIHEDVCPGAQVKVGNMCIWIPPH